jgi:UDP-N-acetylglucosamine 2-epimerase (non-hydrolysing)
MTKLLIVVGTRAEYIKLARLIGVLNSNGDAYMLVETGQHYPHTNEIRDEFAIREPDVVLKPMMSSWGVFGKVVWLLQLLGVIVFAPSVLFSWKEVGVRVVVIQGDTVSTLIGLLLAKRLRIKVAHIESGLRSESTLSPFPEELIRRIVCRFSDMLFAPSAVASSNIAKYASRKLIVSTESNTGLDACLDSLAKVRKTEFETGRDFLLVAVHRIENLHVPWKLQCILKLVLDLSLDFNVAIVSYANTMGRVRNSPLGREIIGRSNVTVIQCQTHSAFLRNMLRASCVVTDGGTIQEECFYMGKSCAVVRDRTERPYCLSARVSLFPPKRNNLVQIEEWIRNQTRLAKLHNVIASFGSYEVSHRIMSAFPTSPTEIIYRTLVRGRWVDKRSRHLSPCEVSEL